MFTQSVLIKKNTQELIEKLINIGYHFSGIGAWAITDGNQKKSYIATTSSTGHFSCITEHAWESSNPHVTWHNGNRIDCEENIDMFLAIAALRNDTDKYQWFVGEYSGDWYYCEDDYCPKKFLSNERWHKANINEIMERFNRT